VGVAKVAQSLGDDTTASATVLHDLWHRLGIGKRTGVDVAGESAGIADDPAKKHWAPIDLANRSFGQGVAVTPIQLATAFSAIANGGRLVQPRVVARVGAQAVKPTPGKKVLDTVLATELQRLMSHVVTSVPRYAAGTLIPGYSVGGKTGTAQIWDSKAGRWFTDRYNFSFVGFVGQARPDAVIAVRIGPAKPLVRRQGDFKLAITSYELFRRVALQVLRARDIPRAEPTVPYEGPGEIGSRPDAP
jgi:cell division protein FtsI (penicillin-binding protein 3)